MANEDDPFPCNSTLMDAITGSNNVRLQFDLLNGRTKNIAPINSNEIMSTDEEEFLQINRDFGYFPFRKLQEMKIQGFMLVKFAECKIPACSAYMTGMMKKAIGETCIYLTTANKL